MPVAGKKGTENQMAHSHDQTYIARLGFADPDRKLPLHDLACQYLAQPIVIERLIQSVFIERRYQTYLVRFDEFSREPVKTGFEVAINKGEGQYKTTVGFLDLVAVWECRCSEFTLKDVMKTSYRGNLRLIAEVKITPVSGSEIIRQINFYREFLRGSSITSVDEVRYVVAVYFDLTEEDFSMLKNENIIPFRLGHKFDAFRKQVSESQKAELEEV